MKLKSLCITLSLIFSPALATEETTTVTKSPSIGKIVSNKGEVSVVLLARKLSEERHTKINPLIKFTDTYGVYLKDEFGHYSLGDTTASNIGIVFLDYYTFPNINYALIQAGDIISEYSSSVDNACKLLGSRINKRTPSLYPNAFAITVISGMDQALCQTEEELLHRRVSFAEIGVADDTVQDPLPEGRVPRVKLARQESFRQNADQTESSATEPTQPLPPKHETPQNLPKNLPSVPKKQKPTVSPPSLAPIVGHTRPPTPRPISESEAQAAPEPTPETPIVFPRARRTFSLHSGAPKETRMSFTRE